MANTIPVLTRFIYTWQHEPRVLIAAGNATATRGAAAPGSSAVEQPTRPTNSPEGTKHE